jgi:hypothetical protein
MNRRYGHGAPGDLVHVDITALHAGHFKCPICVDRCDCPLLDKQSHQSPGA